MDPKGHTAHHGHEIAGREPLVETAYEVGPLSRTAIRTHARVQLGEGSCGGASYVAQEVTATYDGSSRYSALKALEHTLQCLLESVSKERENARGKEFDPRCGCHSCCTLSCCNPVIKPAWSPT